MKTFASILLIGMLIACSPVSTKDAAFNDAANRTYQVQNTCDAISASILLLAKLNEQNKLNTFQITAVDQVINSTEWLCTNEHNDIYYTNDDVKYLIMADTKLMEIVNAAR